MYMMLRVHILSKKVTYIKLKVIGCSPHPIHEYFKVTSLLLRHVAKSKNLGGQVERRRAAAAGGAI